MTGTTALEALAPTMAAELRRQASAILEVAHRLDGKPTVTGAVPPGAMLVVKERVRQIEEEGHTAEHDAGRAVDELAWAAYCYLSRAATADDPDHQDSPAVPSMWPWRDAEWKPKDSRLRNLVVAAALVVAEIDKAIAAEPTA